MDPVRQKAVPRYFTLNGRSGYESMGMTRNEELNRAADEETTISGYPRQFDAREFAEGSAIGSLRGGQLVRVDHGCQPAYQWTPLNTFASMICSDSRVPPSPFAAAESGNTW